MNYPTEKLNLDDKTEPTERRFDEIPVYLESSYSDGFGDFMATLKLAKGLKRKFPDKKIPVYLTSQEDYNLLGNIYPNFHPSQLENEVNGVSVRCVSKESLKSIFKRSLVGVYSLIPVLDDLDGQPNFEEFHMGCGINLYLQEYDSAKRIVTRFNGSPISNNVVYMDKNNRRHILLPTGFSLDSLGIHIDEELIGSSTVFDENAKRSLLTQSGLSGLESLMPDIYKSKWGAAYYNEGARSERFTDFLDPLKMALKGYLQETGETNPLVTIFDFSPFSQFRASAYKSYLNIDPFVNFFILENGSIISSNCSRCREKRHSGVNIVHVGRRSHQTYLEFKRASELPVQITGDLSLSEAISLDKLFIYEGPGWKEDVFADFTALSREYLKSADAERICSLTEPENNAKLFYDLQFQRAFHLMNKKVIRNKNLSKNLSELIKKMTLEE